MVLEVTRATWALLRSSQSHTQKCLWGSSTISVVLRNCDVHWWNLDLHIHEPCTWTFSAISGPGICQEVQERTKLNSQSSFSATIGRALIVLLPGSGFWVLAIVMDYLTVGLNYKREPENWAHHPLHCCSVRLKAQSWWESYVRLPMLGGLSKGCIYSLSAPSGYHYLLQVHLHFRNSYWRERETNKPAEPIKLLGGRC